MIITPNRSVTDAEANLAAKEAPPTARAWLYEAHEHARRAQRPQGQAPERPQAPGALAQQAARRPMEKRYRLTHSADFCRVREHGQSWAQPLLVLSAGRNGLDVTRFGFVVSRRVGSAVVRNRVRRRLREVVRRHQAEFPTGWDVVLVARPAIAQAAFAEIERALVQALARARSSLVAARDPSGELS